jgi:Tfp pilus assembly protein PilV
LLIELTITLTLLVVGVLGLSVAMVASQRCQTWSRDRLLAARVLSKQLEFIGKSNFDDILATYNGKQLKADLTAMEPVNGTTIISRTPVTQAQVTQINSHLLGVTLTATWTDEGGVKTLSLYQEFGQ